jgi:hypothetical protein
MGLTAILLTSALVRGAQAPPQPRDEAVKTELRALITDLNAAVADGVIHVVTRGNGTTNTGTRIESCTSR